MGGWPSPLKPFKHILIGGDWSSPLLMSQTLEEDPYGREWSSPLKPFKHIFMGGELAPHL